MCEYLVGSSRLSCISESPSVLAYHVQSEAPRHEGFPLLSDEVEILEPCHADDVFYLYDYNDDFDENGVFYR
jgi:hypothetical protein